jgi:hypothetical protein
LIVATIILLGVSGLRAVPAQADAGGTVVSRTLVAGPYTLTLRIGPSLRLWTPEQVSTLHPRVGDIVLQEPRAGGSPATANHNLDLHVALRTLGIVIKNVVVAITITTPAGTVVQQVPVGLMQGVDKGPSDIHYGNNVSLPPGHYRIVVYVKRTTATFEVTLAARP